MPDRGRVRLARALCSSIIRPGSSLAAPILLLVFVLALAGCGGSRRETTVTSTGVGSAGGGPDRWGTTWLCRPRTADDPCLTDGTATVVEPNGAIRVERASAAKDPPIDCFYVYPTISGEQTVNASLEIGFRQREVAIAQASRLSRVCKVYAPVYRQITLSALDHPRRITRADARLAYDSVLAAFRDYMAHYNHGRGIVFFGHSQGAAILIRLLQKQVDPSPAIRRHLVAALLMGGDVTVPNGKTVGGDFAHIPACTSTRQTGCVVAYSSFTSKPPSNSQFGRTSSNLGVGLLTRRHLPSNLRILCVNPASPAGDTALLHPYIPSLALGFLPRTTLSVTTPWVSFPGQYSARCKSSGNATWLQVTRVAGGSSRAPTLTELGQPALGLHVLDVNIALGDLVRLVADEAAAYHRH